MSTNTTLINYNNVIRNKSQNWKPKLILYFVAGAQFSFYVIMRGRTNYLWLLGRLLYWVLYTIKRFTLWSPSRHWIVNPSQAIRFLFPKVLIFFEIIPCSFCFLFLYPVNGTLSTVTMESQMHVRILKNNILCSLLVDRVLKRAFF